MAPYSDSIVATMATNQNAILEVAVSYPYLTAAQVVEGTNTCTAHAKLLLGRYGALSLRLASTDVEVLLLSQSLTISKYEVFSNCA